MQSTAGFQGLFIMLQKIENNRWREKVGREYSIISERVWKRRESNSLEMGECPTMIWIYRKIQSLRV